MKVIDFKRLEKLILGHNVPEAKAKAATERLCALNSEATQLQQKVRSERDIRSANIAMKELQALVRKADDIISDMLSDTFHEHMSNGGRKRNRTMKLRQLQNKQEQDKQNKNKQEQNGNK